MKTKYLFILIANIILVSACGGGGSKPSQELRTSNEENGSSDHADQNHTDQDNTNQDNTNQEDVSQQSESNNQGMATESPNNEVIEVSGMNTGTVDNPAFIYYDLETASVLDMNEELASASDDWDIAFKRTDIHLNVSATPPVALHFTQNTDAFYDEGGSPIVDQFVNATPETELAAFESLQVNITDALSFHTDTREPVLDGFYRYDQVTHTAHAKPEAKFIVASDDALARFFVSDIQQSGFGMSSITFSVAYQASGESLFESEKEFVVNTSDCADAVYIDFDNLEVVSREDPWDIQIPCKDGLAQYQLDIADDAKALSGDYANVPGIDAQSFPRNPWSENEKQILAIKDYGDSRSRYGWAEYGVTGGHKMWPNYAIYIIKTEHAYYKFQITRYYDENTGASGVFSVRQQKIF